MLIGNLPGNDNAATKLFCPGSNQDSAAAGFTLPAGSSFVLNDVVLRLGVFTGAVPVVSIYDNNASNNPGTLLQTLINPVFPTGGTANYSFSSAVPLSLAAATTYWVVVSNTAPMDNFFVWWASNPAVTPTGIATSAGYRLGSGTAPPTGPNPLSNSYAVNAVPEPSTWALLAVGAGMFGVSMLRRRIA